MTPAHMQQKCVTKKRIGYHLKAKVDQTISNFIGKHTHTQDDMTVDDDQGRASGRFCLSCTYIQSLYNTHTNTYAQEAPADPDPWAPTTPHPQQPSLPPTPFFPFLLFFHYCWSLFVIDVLVRHARTQMCA